MARLVWIGVGALCAVLFACGCGSEAGGSRHAAERPTPAPAPPTPDTTPIEALRTPAGLALRIDVSSTPAPAATPTPAAATTVSTKSALESGGSTSPSRASRCCAIAAGSRAARLGSDS
jgi:hypothetical protein